MVGANTFTSGNLVGVNSGMFGAAGAGALASIGPVYDRPVDDDSTPTGGGVEKPADAFVEVGAQPANIALKPASSKALRSHVSNFDFNSDNRRTPNFLRGLGHRLYNRLVSYRNCSYPKPLPLRTLVAQHFRNALRPWFTPFYIGGVPASNVNPKQLNPLLLDSVGNFRVFTNFTDLIAALEKTYGRPWIFGEPTMTSIKYGGGEYPEVETPSLSKAGTIFYGPIHHHDDCVAQVNVDERGGSSVLIRHPKNFTKSGIYVEHLGAESPWNGYRPMASEFPVRLYFTPSGVLEKIIVSKSLYYWGHARGQTFGTFNSKILTSRMVMFDAAAEQIRSPRIPSPLSMEHGSPLDTRPMP